MQHLIEVTPHCFTETHVDINSLGNDLVIVARPGEAERSYLARLKASSTSWALLISGIACQTQGHSRLYNYSRKTERRVKTNESPATTR